MKMKNSATPDRRDLTLKHGYIDVNQEFIRCRNHSNILSLFERLGRSHTSLLSSL
jgi:hypothetical protein